MKEVVRSHTPMKEATTVEIWTHPHPQVKKNHTFNISFLLFCSKFKISPPKLQYLGLLKQVNNMPVNRQNQMGYKIANV